MNTPKITFKKAFFRIFWKMLAKTGPQSLYLCGFPEVRVEMKIAPFRALPQAVFCLHFNILVEMKDAPFRAYNLSTRINKISHQKRSVVIVE